MTPFEQQLKNIIDEVKAVSALYGKDRVVFKFNNKADVWFHRRFFSNGDDDFIRGIKISFGLII